MSKYIGHLCLLLLAANLFASCLNTDNDETTLYDDVAIAEFQITSAKVFKHTTSSTGVDSVYVVTDESVQNYPFYIDQQRGEIYNVDSLPLGTDPTRLLCSAQTKNNAMVYIENAARDSIKSLTTTDSTDFSTPRYVRAYATNGQSHRVYKITVNIHQEDADSFRWVRLADNGSVAGLSGMRLVRLGTDMLLLGRDGDATVIYRTAETDGNTWTRIETALGADTYNNVAVRNDSLFVIDNGTLKVSVDGENFAGVAGAAALSRLIGASASELYGMAAGGALACSADGGRTWDYDNTDTGAELLPSQDIAFCCSPFSAVDSTDYVVLAGNRAEDAFPADTKAVVWRKIVEYAKGGEKGKWAYLEPDEHSFYQLPRLAGLTVLAYGNSKIAFGGVGVGACDKDAFAQVYESRDGGVTWKNNSRYAFPSGFDSSATAFAATVDSHNNIWVVCAGSGQVWRGRLNRMGWN